MTNKYFWEQLNDVEVKIDKLFWIALSEDNSDLKDLLENIPEKDWAILIPEVYNDKQFKVFFKEDELIDLLKDKDKFGFIAEIHVPVCDNFSFIKGKPTSWSSSFGRCQVRYAYGEDRASLFDSIRLQVDAAFAYFVEKAKRPKK